MDVMEARKRLLMRKRGLDTSPVILQYDVRLWSDGSITTKNGACITKSYDYDVGLNRRFDHYGLASSTINYKNGEFFDYWNVPSDDAPKTNQILAASNTQQIQFTLITSLLDDCYVINVGTGDILFAGKNSIYYGHRNISELN